MRLVSFITKLYALVEYCEYGALREEMIRDCLVVGLLDATLSEKLQLDPDLTLEKAIAKVRNAETVKISKQLSEGRIQAIWIPQLGQLERENLDKNKGFEGRQKFL